MIDLRDRLVPMPGARMSRHVRRAAHAIACGAMLLAAASCHTADTAPTDDGKDLSELHELHVTYDYPKLATPQVSFYAVKGKVSGADLWYHARPGAADSTKFVEFRLGAGSLDKRPDGSAIAMGDSVLITLTASDPTHMMIEFQPSGLKFSITDQPSLKMFWVACGDDVNYDGKVDANDDLITSQLGIWRQETPGARWFHLGSAVLKGSREIDVQLAGFTGYAIMY